MAVDYYLFISKNLSDKDVKDIGKHCISDEDSDTSISFKRYNELSVLLYKNPRYLISSSDCGTDILFYAMMQVFPIGENIVITDKVREDVKRWFKLAMTEENFKYSMSDLLRFLRRHKGKKAFLTFI